MQLENILYSSITDSSICSERKKIIISLKFSQARDQYWKCGILNSYIQVPMTAKYPKFTQWGQILRKQFLEGYDWFTAYNRGTVSNLW